VYIRDSRDQVVAYFDSDVSFTPVTGSMSLVSASLAPATVYAAAALSWTIQAAHYLRAADAPSLTIELPTDYTVPSACTTTSDADAYGGSRTCSTNTIQNTLTVSNLVDSDWAGGGTLSFSTALITLPTTSAGGQGEFRLTTYVSDAANGERHAVDAAAFSEVFTIAAGGFESATVSSSSGDALVQAGHTFTIVPTHLMPQYGVIMVVYPSQVAISDASLSQTLCAGWVGFTSETPVCTIFTANNTIIVSKGFQQAAGGAAAATTYSWTVPYVTNPPTLLPTDSYSITIRDQFYAIIDEISGDGGDPGVSLQISNAALFQNAELELARYQNAVGTKYTFTIVATCQVVSGNVFLVVFPSRISLPATTGDLGCSSASTAYFESMSCTRTYINRGSSSAGGSSSSDGSDGSADGESTTAADSSDEEDNAVLIEFTLRQDIPELETFSFSIDDVINPTSTAPTAPVVV
jgi:hypothetical protein